MAGPAGPARLKSWLVRRLPARAAARLVLRYRRLRVTLERRLPHASRSGALTALSHGGVLALGLLLVLPALPASGRGAQSTTPVVAQAGLAQPIALKGRMAGQLSEIELERRDNPPPAPPPAAAPPRPAAPAKPATGIFTPPPGSGGDGLAAIYAVFNGSPGLSWALRVANCESHYNPLAVNRYSGASGLFQFMPSTWNANFPGWNIWDPMAQARAALIFYNAGRQSAWTCK
jgi:transglycosylase-like protein with SLT domain